MLPTQGLGSPITSGGGWRGGEFFIELGGQGMKGLVGLFPADIGDENHGEVTLGIEPDLGQVFGIGAAVGYEAGGGPGNRNFPSTQSILPLLGGAGFGPWLIRDSDNRRMQLRIRIHSREGVSKQRT